MQFKLNEQNKEWIESKIGHSSQGYLIKSSTLYWLIEREIEFDRSINYTSKEPYFLTPERLTIIINDIDDDSGTIISINKIIKILKSFIDCDRQNERN
jgi:hypothetical protein